MTEVECAIPGVEQYAKSIARLQQVVIPQKPNRILHFAILSSLRKVTECFGFLIFRYVGSTMVSAISRDCARNNLILGVC